MGRYVVGVYLLDKSHNTPTPTRCIVMLDERSRFCLYTTIPFSVPIVVVLVVVCNTPEVMHARYVYLYNPYMFPIRKAFVRETRSFALQRFVKAITTWTSSIILYKSNIIEEHTIIVSHYAIYDDIVIWFCLAEKISLPNGFLSFRSRIHIVDDGVPVRRSRDAEPLRSSSSSTTKNKSFLSYNFKTPN